MQKLVPKKLKQKNDEKGISIGTRTKLNKIKINKTHSMDNASNKYKKPSIDNILKSQKMFNNSMEELDYLNFSRINLDIYRKNVSLEEDIFNPKSYFENNKDNNKIVQNRYIKIDSSNDTIISKNNNVLESENDLFDKDKNNIILQTPSTICNYYEKSENYSDEKNKNCINDNFFKQNSKYKKLRTKSIQVPNYYLNNNINNNLNNNNNHPIYSNRLKPPKNDSLLSLKKNQNINSKNYIYKPKSRSTFDKFKGCSKTKMKEDISSSIFKRRNLEYTNYLIFHNVKNKNNLIHNYINYVDKSKKNVNNYTNKIKSFSTYNYPKNINSKAKNKNIDYGYSNNNKTYNIDSYNYIEKKENISNILKPIKEDTKNNNIIKNSIGTITNNNMKLIQQKIIQNNNFHNLQRPIKLYLNKRKFSTYFINPTTFNSDKKDNEKNSINSINKDLEKDLLCLNVNSNNSNITDDFTGRNNKKCFNNKKKDIIVQRKRLNKTNSNVNCCDKSISSNNANTTFTHYQNDRPLIRVNLKKQMKYSTELIQFINLDTKNKNEKNKKNNDSLVNSCWKGSKYTSPMINELINKNKILKSPLQVKNNNTLKSSKSLKDNRKFNKIPKSETINAIDKNPYINSNRKNYYYELNIKSTDNNSNFNKNKSKIIVKPKTQSDIKVKNHIIIDENSKNENNDNKENKDNNNGNGMDEGLKQKLVDKMNKIPKNNLGYIWGGYLALKRNMKGNIGGIMKSPETYHLLYYNKDFPHENSKNEEKDSGQKLNENRNQKDITIIKEYKASKLSKTFI